MSTFFKKLLLVAVVVTLIILVFKNQTARAQTTSLDVTLNPVFFDYNSKPGDTISDKLRIRNNTSQSLQLKAEIKKLGPDKNGLLTIKDEKDDTLNWVKFEKDQFEAKSKEWTDVPFSIKIPQDAAFGYYWAITITQANQVQNTQNAANVSGVGAVSLLLNVKKDGARSEARIVEFKTQKINEFLPVSFETKIQNTGNIHIRPKGNIFISGPGAKDLAVLDVTPSTGAVIPSTIKTYETSWSDSFIVREAQMENNQPQLDKNGKTKTHLVVHWDKLTHFRFGPYTANLVIAFDNGRQDVLLESKVSFWVIPYKIIILILFSAIILIIIMKKLLHSYVSSQIKKAKE